MLWVRVSAVRVVFKVNVFRVVVRVSVVRVMGQDQCGQGCV